MTTCVLVPGPGAGRRYGVTDADQVFEIDTGHDLMITEPWAVADVLLGLAPR